MTEKVDILLRGGTVVTMNGKYDVFEDGAVAIRDDSIVAVGPTAQLTHAYSAAEEVDCTDTVIIPGFVNAHTHIPMTLMRGLNDDLRLDVWLGYLMPVERQFVTPEFVKLGARVACAEMIRSGVTSFADMFYYEEAIAEQVAEIGMRALLGETILVFPAPDAEPFEAALLLCRDIGVNKSREGWVKTPSCPAPSYPGSSLSQSIDTSGVSLMRKSNLTLGYAAAIALAFISTPTFAAHADGKCKLTNVAVDKSIYDGDCQIHQEETEYGTLISVKLGNAESRIILENNRCK